ncbi:hypothetical protein QQX98_001378 [Neonectria punicea]|uniref:NADP-dependent oxidoreductase domain-containing protein n=1 Tax=Neonectria punicea TaxID=979145 RepID=A0ABR1HNT2_9HYPO
MTVPRNGRANVRHVNMMTDTIIANLPPDGLRVVIRSLLASHPEITSSLERETRKFAVQNAAAELNSNRPLTDIASLQVVQRQARCMLGSGLCFQSLPLLSKLVSHATNRHQEPLDTDTEERMDFYASVDHDIVQAMTAVQKSLFVATGTRAMTEDEKALLQSFSSSLTDCVKKMKKAHPFSRGLAATANVLGDTGFSALGSQSFFTRSMDLVPHPCEAKESFTLGHRTLPRIFSGLWQMSSPAWGTAPTSKIVDQISKHVQEGFTAFDMADHYGDAEIIFGHFWSAWPHKDSVFTATKYCVFHAMTSVSREAIQATVTERCQRLQQNVVDLLQFHWQYYENPQYLDVLAFLSEDDRVGMIGLCNFDTKHLETVLDSGTVIVSNQVQFSLIDSRPTIEMGAVCLKHNVKLLTYGTLCGGFLAEKWLDTPEPDLYDLSITPSQRKYHGVIRSWGGWPLFQELLKTLQTIAVKHGVEVSNVATRWVLDFPYVGAVIVGARMGISEHTKSNLASFGWSLDQEDQDAIEKVLETTAITDDYYPERWLSSGHPYEFKIRPSTSPLVAFVEVLSQLIGRLGVLGPYHIDKSDKPAKMLKHTYEPKNILAPCIGAGEADGTDETDEAT